MGDTEIKYTQGAEVDTGETGRKHEGKEVTQQMPEEHGFKIKYDGRGHIAVDHDMFVLFLGNHFKMA